MTTDVDEEKNKSKEQLKAGAGVDEKTEKLKDAKTTEEEIQAKEKEIQAQKITAKRQLVTASEDFGYFISNFLYNILKEKICVIYMFSM